MAAATKEKAERPHREPKEQLVDYRGIFKWESIYDLEKLKEKLGTATILSFDTETTGLDYNTTKIAGFSFTTDGINGYYCPIGHKVDKNAPRECLDYIVSIICDNKYTILMFNKRYDLNILELCEGYELGWRFNVKDIQCAVWLRDTGYAMPSLKWASKHFLGIEQPRFDEVTGDKTFDYAMVEDVCEYASLDALCTYHLCMRTFKTHPQLKGIFSIDDNAVEVIRKMEHGKIKLDTDWLRKESDSMFFTIKEKEKEIYSTAGYEFNINSGPQTAQALQSMGCVLTVKTDGGKGKGWATDADTLSKLDHPVAKLLTEHSHMTTYNSTFLQNLLLEANKSGDIRFQYRPYSVVTGRYSSGGDEKNSYYAKLNAQNIPKPKQYEVAVVQCSTEESVTGWKTLDYDVVFNKDEEGNVTLKEGYDVAYISEAGKKDSLRGAFLPDDEDSVWVSIDYSGEELRIAANFSGEPTFITAFTTGGDPHMTTAKAIYGAEAGKNERRMAKGANFALQYGGSAFTLQTNLGLTKAAADDFYNKYCKAMPTLIEWQNYMKRLAKRTGMVTSAFGRELHLGKYFTAGQKWSMISYGERCALNYPIQGCMPYKTRVLTNKGYYRIGDLYFMYKQGKQLPELIYTGTSWEKYIPVNRGEAELCDVHYSNGYIEHCDVRHKVWCEDINDFIDVLGSEDKNVCFSYARRLVFGEQQKPFTVTGVENQHGISRYCVTKKDITELWWVMGYYMGDGGVRVRNNNPENINFTFGLHKRKHFERIQKLMSTIGCHNKDWYISRGSEGEAYCTDYNCTPLLMYIETHWGFNFTQNCYTKRIPDAIWKETLENRTAFTQGFFCADGNQESSKLYNTEYQNLHLANHDVLQDMMVLLRTIGINSTVNRTGENSWRLQTHYSEYYKEVFGGYVVSKIKSDKRYISESVRNRILFTVEEQSIKLNSKTKDYAILYKLRKGEKVSLHRGVQLAKSLGVFIDDILYDNYKVTKVEKQGIYEDTYTLSVFSDLHRFDSEGVISKNTGGDVIKIAFKRIADYYISMQKAGHKGFEFRSTVHDEINFSTKKYFMHNFMRTVPKLMTMSFEGWAIPLEADISIGNTWSEAIPYKYNEETRVYTPKGHKITREIH